MADWTRDDLYRLDLKYAEEGITPHQRPMRAAKELLGSGFAIGAFGNPEVEKITRTYVELFPEVKSTWPGTGIGLAASVDQVRKLVLPVDFGTASPQPWQAGFANAEEWWSWCRGQEAIASSASFAFADLLDFSTGLSRVGHQKPKAERLWKLTQSNLADVANALPAAFSVDSVTQPICMVAELALKAHLVWKGADPDSFRGPDGHDLVKLAESMAQQSPYRDDPLVAEVVGNLPHYVASRYDPAGLSRLQVVRLALGVQFVAASTLRRISGVDFAAEMEGSRREPRQPFFPQNPQS
jgi:hypothetical protein